MLQKTGIIGAALIALAVLVVTFNYLRHWVFFLPNEEIQFASADIQLAGTFVKPDEHGKFPGVVLLHGSGPETRSDPTTHAVVNALARSGFAVLAYDKRGAGESEGDFDSALYSDFIDDAIAAVEYLANRDDVDAERIGIYAVSEAGWFAPEIALRTQRIDFIFNKVGPPISRFEQFKWEARHEYLADGIAADDIDAIMQLAERRYQYYLSAAADPTLRSGPERDAINAEIARLRQTIPGAEQAMASELGDFDDSWYSAFAADAAYDPAPYLLELDIPLYYAYGGADVNVPAQQCTEVLQELVEEHGKDITYVVYPGLGHSLMSWKGLLSAGLPPGYLERLGEWARQQAGVRLN